MRVFEVDEHGGDLLVEWSLEEDMSYADYLEREAFRTWKEEVEEMQYLMSCEPSGDAVEVISIVDDVLLGAGPLASSWGRQVL